MVAYPAGGKRGEQIKVQVVGDATGPIEQEVTVPTDPNADTDLFIEDKGASRPRPSFSRLLEGNILETEPNDDLKTANAAELPLALNGRLQKKGDADCFKFAAKKGQVWEIECYARRIGSPMDSVFTIYKDDKAKSLIAGNDDARGQDSYLRWQVPEDGNYYIRITDHLGQGGDTLRLSSRNLAGQAVAEDRHPAQSIAFAIPPDRRRSSRQPLRAFILATRRFRRAHRAVAEELDSWR